MCPGTGQSRMSQPLQDTTDRAGNHRAGREPLRAVRGVGARRPAGGGPDRGARVRPGTRSRAGRVVAGRPAGRRRDALRVPARRRAAAARPALAPPARRPGRAERGGRPRRLPLAVAVAGARAARARCCTNCTSAPSPPRAPSTRRSSGCRTWPRLGVTHVELMPVCPFPGTSGWGYEGVSLWAVHEPYGGPEAMKRFVDAAHQHCLGVVLDVVHNHLGPSGNHLPPFGPYFTDRHHTPWGDAVNLDAPGSDEVRDFLIGSALAWLRDYRLDGLRLDAVHALVDTRALHFLEELSTAVDGLSAALRPTAVPDRRVRPQRPADHRAARGGRPRPARPVERRLPPRRAHRRHRRDAGLLRGLRRRRAGRARQGAHPRLLPRRLLVVLPRPAPRPSAGPRGGRPRTGCSATPRPTTRSATGPPATGSPPNSSAPPPRWC